MELQHRWLAGRLPPPHSAQITHALVLSKRAAALGDAETARMLADQAHRMSQNDPYLHLRAHLGRARAFRAQGRAGGALGELRLATLAPLASVLRRVSGYAPGQDNPPSMWRTWSERPTR